MKVVDAVNVHVGLSLLPVILAGQAVLAGQVSSDGVRLGQHLAVYLQNRHLAEGHLCKVQTSKRPGLGKVVTTKCVERKFYWA